MKETTKSLETSGYLPPTSRVDPGLRKLLHLLHHILATNRPRLNPPHPMIIIMNTPCPSSPPRTPRPNLIHRIIQYTHISSRLPRNRPLIIQLMQIERRMWYLLPNILP